MSGTGYYFAILPTINSFMGSEPPKIRDLRNFYFFYDSVKHIYFFEAHLKSVIDGTADCWPYF